METTGICKNSSTQHSHHLEELGLHLCTSFYGIRPSPVKITRHDIIQFIISTKKKLYRCVRRTTCNLYFNSFLIQYYYNILYQYLYHHHPSYLILYGYHYHSRYNYYYQYFYYHYQSFFLSLFSTPVYPSIWVRNNHWPFSSFFALTNIIKRQQKTGTILYLTKIVSSTSTSSYLLASYQSVDFVKGNSVEVFCQ